MVRLFLALMIALFASSAWADVPDRRIAVSRNVDFYGSDLQTIFDTTLNACQAACFESNQCSAFTYNQRSSACFLKSSVSSVEFYDGATSARLYPTAPSVLAQAAARTAELDFLTDRDFEQAADLARTLGRTHSVDEQSAVDLLDAATVRRGAGDTLGALRLTGAALTLTDAAADWVEYTRLAQQLTADNDTHRAARERAIPAAIAAYQRAPNDGLRVAALLELAPALEDADRGRAMIPALRLAQAIQPRRDVEVALEDANGKYGFRVVDTQVESDSATPRICAAFSEDLIAAGTDYTPYVNLPDPALVVQVNDGQLCIDGVRHGERYRVVLRQGLPGANGETLARDTELSLYVRDRSPAVRFPSQAYVLPRAGDIAVPVETVNITDVDLTLRRLSDRNIVRAMQSRMLNRQLYDYEQRQLDEEMATRVWDGVMVRSLADASAVTGSTVTLISDGNAVLGTAMSDASGVATFPPGLTRGRGTDAPALVTVEMGDDMAYLSLNDAAFDLSDRGVEGREPAAAIDTFLATDRGAYRAGETIHATALMRDATAQAVPDVPLTAVLTRPDGVEYSRTTSTTGVAGGHVFALPVADTAPRGTWRIAVLADTDAEPLATQGVLVEDFLPERIDFDLSLPDGLRLGDDPTLSVEARYLFGAPASDLDVEGEALLRPTQTVAGWDGYRFGRYDDPVDAELTYLDVAQTDPAGAARMSVERQITAPVLPTRDMIGIAPLFDGVVGEGTMARFDLVALSPDLEPTGMDVVWTVNRVETRYQWYSLYGDWMWEPVTSRERVATGSATLEQPVTVEAPVDWGRYEIVVEKAGGDHASASMGFDAGWYAPATARDTPDVLQASLDADSYAVGDTAMFRVVPRYAGTAVVTVMTDRVIAMETVQVSEGENTIPLPVTDDWGAGAYVSASVIRPMDAAAGRNPARALGLGYAQVDPGDAALSVSLDAPDQMQPRQAMEVGITVDGVTEGETAYVTLAAVDLGILNITGFDAPDPQGHYFGQRKLGVEMRDLYGRLIDGMNGAMGTVRSGGDAMGNLGMQSPPPTEELVAYFTGPLTVGADGTATASIDLPAFNGTVKLMAIAWTDSGIGQADRDVLVRDPIVLTASAPRFLAPGDQSRMLLEVQHTDGPAGEIGLGLLSDGLAIDARGLPTSFTLAEGEKQTFEVPFGALDAGTPTLTVVLTTPDGESLAKDVTVPVLVNDPEVSRVSRFTLAAGDTFTFDDQAFAGFAPGTGSATLSVGPLARFDAPGLLRALDRYPYGCTEQITSQAMPLLYMSSVAQAMGLASAADVAERVDQAILEVTANQARNGGFGLWRASSGDLWLAAYVTDFLGRARGQGFTVPEVAFDSAIDNLRNEVNYYPDFDAGGEDLAYALMVLAREGAANVGDLRYYADEKGGAFGSPTAQAQLGMALSLYGDPRRADAMFALAENRLMRLSPPPAGQSVWRADYGTNRRDAAAVLALATEAGSMAVDTASIAQGLAQETGRASTQEAAWTLLAANAMIDDLRTAGITVDGAAPDGPIVRLREQRVASAPVRVSNGSDAPTEVTVTSFGVPSDPLPAGGEGYAITRAYYTTEGAFADPATVASGERLVAVLTVTPFGLQEARLMVDDPLPAGFEIDNPNLLRSGDIARLDWLDIAPTETAEFRADRFLAAVDWRSDAPFQLAYIVRAVSPGTFHHPAASVEDMYRPQLRARTDAGRVTVTD
ncbi:MAG: alpha-2-macroglobulin family protein [Loktanella sp.]|nr:alpha-2-macroglobulin family protein [Loktanella sp.]